MPQSSEYQSPNTKANTVLQSESIDPKKVEVVKKKLTLMYSMLEEVKIASQKKIDVRVRNVVAGMTVKKYRLQNELSKELKLNCRMSKSAAERKAININKKRLFESQKDTERAIYEFLELDECSTCLPGKKDKVTVDRNVKQKRVLTDYMTNLHNNLLADYSTKKVSFVVFCRLRPAHIKLASFPTRQTCLCQRHQNLSLKAVAIRERGVHCSSNPETFAQQSDAQIHEQLASFPQKIYFDQWQIESNVYLGKVVKKTKLAINNELEKSDFVTQVKKIIDFRSHVSREQKQYTELRNLKNKICPEHVLIQMDFAENFACSHADEVQSAYHSKPAVTLHSAVIYYLREGESEL